MIILPYRVRLIENHFFEFSFDSESEKDLTPDFEVFKTLSSAEQYFLASIYNWDDGTKVLEWIIDSPKCDKGTAVMIFWLAEPDYYFNYSEETVDDSDRDIWQLLQKVIHKIRNKEFKRSLFAFNPDENGYKTDWESANGIWELPPDLINGTSGLKPIALRFK